MQYTIHKIGDTYSRARLYALGAGVWTAASSVYGPGGVLVQALSCTLSALPAPDAAGNTHALAVLATPAQTALWPAGALVSDVVFTDASGATTVVQSAQPYVIRCGRYAGATDSDNPLAVLPAELAAVLRGADGLSAYQLAVAAGFEGTEAQWHASLVGPAGATSWDALEGKPTFGDAAGKNTGTVAGTVAAGDHGHTAAQVGAIPTGGLKTVNGNGLEGSGDIAVSATPGGSTTQVQFNNAGAFGGDSGLTFDSATKTLSANGGTRTASGSTLTVSETWNNAGVAFPGALVVDVTDTASGGDSLLANLKVGGVSKFSVAKNGRIDGPVDVDLFGGNTTATENYLRSYGGILALGQPGSVSFLAEFAASSKLIIGANSLFGWSSSPAGTPSELRANMNTVLASDAANTVAQRNGTAAQTARIYGTWTDLSNGRWLESSMSSAGVAVIKPTGNGTGASGNVLHISGLPTSNPGPGILWNNGGSVAIGT